MTYFTGHAPLPGGPLRRLQPRRRHALGQDAHHPQLLVQRRVPLDDQPVALVLLQGVGHFLPLLFGNEDQINRRLGRRFRQPLG